MIEAQQQAEKVKAFLENAKYMDLTTSTLQGRSSSADVRFVQGHSLCLYWVSSVGSQKSKNIEENAFVTLKIANPFLAPNDVPAGEGVKLYLEGLAQRFEPGVKNLLPLPNHVDEHYKTLKNLCDGRDDLRGKHDEIFEGKSSKRLFRAFLTKAHFNDGSWDEENDMENDARVDLEITCDEAVPLIRRYIAPREYKTGLVFSENQYASMLGVQNYARA